jgi:hypothetical protein
MNHITRQLTTSITKFAKIIQISLSTSWRLPDGYSTIPNSYPTVIQPLSNRYEPHHPTTHTINYKICKFYSNLAFHILMIIQELLNSYPTVS